MSLMVGIVTSGADTHVQMVEQRNRVLLWVIYGPASLRICVPKIRI